MTNCFPLNSIFDGIVNNRISFRNPNNNSVIREIGPYGLYDTSNNKNYIIRDVSKNYPLTFYNSSNHSYNTISNIIVSEPLNKNIPIIIYVSKGQDYSFNNNDYFRFYDSTYELLNINHGGVYRSDSSLSTLTSNFYFMNSQKYKFIATRDICSSQPFTISGSSLSLIGDRFLSRVGASFEITIPNDANNNINKIFYADNDNDISGDLFILRDNSSSYYYGDISFSITNYSNYSSTKISIKPYNFNYGIINNFDYNTIYGNSAISNIDFFSYSDSCRYITLGYTYSGYELLNKISAIDLSINSNNTFRASFNKNRHLINSGFNYDLSFGLAIKDYHIIDISKNFPLRLLNVSISNSIYIDETYQPYRLGIDTISGINFYYGSLKIKVVNNFSKVDVKFISLSNDLVDSSYIVTFNYDDTLTASRHIVYDNSSNSIPNYDLSNTILDLRNQFNSNYSITNYTNPSNQFTLNLYTDYNELGFISKDRLNNVLTNYVSITPPIEALNLELSANFLNSPFYIYYNVIDYENSTVQNIRAIKLNAGPIIEISNNYNTNNNSIFDFNINSNSNASSYNFYEDIKVFIYDKSKNKVTIPFELVISGSYFNSDRVSTSYNNSYTFKTFGPLNAINYYSIYNTNILTTDSKIITLKNIDTTSVRIDNSLNPLFLYAIRETIITYISSISSINSIAFEKKDNTPFSFNITSKFDEPLTIYNFNLAPAPNKIDVSLGLSPTKFFFTAIDTNLQTFTISGNFIKPLFFNDTGTSGYIDLSYIGNYNLTINTKSLGLTDSYRLEYSGNFFDPTMSDISKTYKILVQDKEAPSLTFFDISGKILTDLVYFKYYLPRRRPFKIINDICFIKFSVFTLSYEYIDDNPVLLYNDNSIYNLLKSDLSFSVVNTSSNIKFNANEVSYNAFIDASCIINYRVKDICANYSQVISLELNFINIPNVRLKGPSIKTLEYVDDLSFKDLGLEFLNGTSVVSYEPSYNIFSYNNTDTIETPFSDFNGFYSITLDATNIDFRKLGNYYLEYTIVQLDNIFIVNGPAQTKTLTRLIKIVDTTKPYIFFPDLSFIIDGSIGRLVDGTRYWDARAPRSIIYSFTNRTNNIDLSFTIKTHIEDVKIVIDNFDLCDNYFLNPDPYEERDIDLSWIIRVNNNTTPFILDDLYNYFDSSFQLNKVTHPFNTNNLNYRPPIIFKYTIFDGCNNTFSFDRIVNIVDNVAPTITFNFSNCYNDIVSDYFNYEYVTFDNLNINFSYVAFNHLNSLISIRDLDFNKEINSILFDFTLSDNMQNINQNNFTITISGSSVSALNNKAIGKSSSLLTNDVKDLFKKIGSSFSLLYDISDNQNNGARFTRDVIIIDDPIANFTFSYLNSDIGSLTLSFGDTNFNLQRDVSINHNRLSRADISYDISFTFSNSDITSISGSGSTRYDTYALIYTLGSVDISYFPENEPTNTKSLEVNVINPGPQITFSQGKDISHQSYTRLSDASLIFGVLATSIYDEFYYYNNYTTISYSETNFSVILDVSLNVNDPLSGTYNLIYSSRDKYGTDFSTIRHLFVYDTQAPVFTLIYGDNKYPSSNRVWTLSYNSVYIEYGANVYDSATKIVSYINNGLGSPIPNSLYRSVDGIQYNIGYKRITSTTSESISLESINTSLIDICYEVIYRVKDLCNNEIVETRTLKITRNKQPLLYPYIEVHISSLLQSSKSFYYLLKDLSNNDVSLTQINKSIPSNLGNLTQAINYDLSLGFVNKNDNNIITCEAIKQIVFSKTTNANYVRFKLYATSYDGSRNLINSSYVDYSINSLRVYNSPIDYQPITFYAIDSCQNILEQQNSITLYLKIIDTKPPNVRLLTNVNFTDPNRLDYPLLSQAAITILKSSNQINYFDSYENTYLNYIRYYKLTLQNVVLIDPGLAIEDIVDGNLNYINEELIPDNTNFRISDISVVYLKQSNQPNQPNQISNILNVLTISGNYIQKYSVKDRQNNNVDVSRIIFVTSFPPIIRLNYQQDSSNNDYSLYLMQRYDKIIEKNGTVRDFSDITIDFEKVSIDYSNFNENLCGSYFVNYSVANSNNLIGRTTRKVEVYDPIILKKNNNYNFSQLISNLNGTSKFSLTNGVYNFDVSYNLAFTIVAQNFDTSKNPYNISNLLTIISDLSFIFETEKYYYNKVALTITGNFERCSVKFRTISDIINPFKSNLINNIARYLFVYSANDYFINLQDYYNTLKYPDPTTITKSFVIDVSNLNNNAGSLAFFTIDSKKQDLHLAYGVYRFKQNTYKNFYNRIRFSSTYDGTHNGGIEYTKTVFINRLPGISRLSSNVDIYTQITINATTPGVLYYYSENFKNMGGKIEIKNNIVLQKNIVILNSYVLTSDTNNFFTSTNTFLGISNEKMNDRIVLNQRFDLSFIKPNVNTISNTISNINICCITQKNIKNNIFYNLNRHPNKLIIGKHNTSFINTIYSINSSTYLVDTSRISFNNTYINQFNITYESSYALIKTPDLTTYDRSLKNVFYYNHIYNTNVRSDDNILNYMNFFKNNPVIPSELTVNDFSYAISEFLFARPSNILNLDSANIYANSSASNTSYLLAPKIKITNIIDNYVMFSLDVIYKNLLFQTFEFIVYSSRNTSFSTLSDTVSMERLFFYNSSLVLANHLLYSSTISCFYNGPNIFEKLYTDPSVPIMNVTQNMVFLNIQDNSSTSSVCGITKQNLYNNMYIDESGNFIFHKYNENTIVNYQVNDANLTLEKTLQENSNNQLYLLDVCSNVFYNSFNNNALTINALTDLSTNKNYSIALTYKIYDEIDSSTNYNLLDSLYIVPIYDNDIPQYRRINNIYSTYYNYNRTINNLTSDLHSNCYAINLSDYFDITLVNNRLSQLNILNININKKNLIYTLQDISYNNNNFTLFNLESSFNIIYEKVNITILNVMQIKLFNLYFKLKHLLYILANIWSLSANSINYINSINNRISYTSTINVHLYSEFFQFNNFLINSFDSTLSTLALNILYKDILTDTKNFITIYNEIINNFGFFLTYVIILNPVYSVFELNNTILEQLTLDLNILTENIDNLILSEQTKLDTALAKPSSLIFPNYRAIIKIDEILTSFYYIYNGSQIYFKTLNVHRSVNQIGPDIPLFSEQFRNLLDKSNVNPIIFLENCKANLALLNNYFNSIKIDTDYDTLNIATSVFNLNIVNISDFSQFIELFNSFQNHFTNLIENYTTVERPPSSITYINTNFELTGSQILIHSKISNSISLTFNIQYKSYFFNYIDISTIVLDVTLPDLTPPTLVFANNNYTLNQSDLTSSSIISVITNLIKDVSYIDLNQQHTLNLNNTYYSYYSYIDTNSAIISNYFTNSLVEINLPRVTARDFGINNTTIIDILYKIKDNANNINTIIRKLLINKSLSSPTFYYRIESTFYLKIVDQINLKLEILENINVLALKNELINNIYIIDPPNILADDLLAAPILNASDFFLISSIILRIINVDIRDQSNILIASYNVIDDTFINYYNFTTPGGRQLANNSITLLQPRTYNLTYVSSISALSDSFESVTRILQVNPIVVSVVAQIDPHCCYPKVEYKPIQDNYKLGSQNTIKMRRAKFIINRNR
jgi:hypothetical protein